MVSMTSREIFSQQRATSIITSELRKNAPFYPTTKVIFEISVSFSTIYQKQFWLCSSPLNSEKLKTRRTALPL